MTKGQNVIASMPKNPKHDEDEWGGRRSAMFLSRGDDAFRCSMLLKIVLGMPMRPLMAKSPRWAKAAISRRAHPDWLTRASPRQNLSAKVPSVIGSSVSFFPLRHREKLSTRGLFKNPSSLENEQSPKRQGLACPLCRCARHRERLTAWRIPAQHC
jgi:hypothetical protein